MWLNSADTASALLEALLCRDAHASWWNKKPIIQQAAQAQNGTSSHTDLTYTDCV